MTTDRHDSMPVRKRLPHARPAWVADDAVYFITINTASKGQNHLCVADIPARLWTSVVFNAERGVWWPHVFLLMPDHLHGLFTFAPEPGMSTAIRSWKHYAAREFNVAWQRDFFDHRLRSHESLREKSHYIRKNPVRKGLVAKAEEWEYVWSMDGFVAGRLCSG